MHVRYPRSCFRVLGSYAIDVCVGAIFLVLMSYAKMKETGVGVNEGHA